MGFIPRMDGSRTSSMTSTARQAHCNSSGSALCNCGMPRDTFPGGLRGGCLNEFGPARKQRGEPEMEVSRRKGVALKRFFVLRQPFIHAHDLAQEIIPLFGAPHGVQSGIHRLHRGGHGCPEPELGILGLVQRLSRGVKALEFFQMVSDLHGANYAKLIRQRQFADRSADDAPSLLEYSPRRRCPY